MILTCSHLVLATEDVTRAAKFFGALFDVSPHFENEQFCEFVLPSRFRIAFFKVVGPAAKYFKATTDREGLGIGVTVKDVEAIFKKLSEDASLRWNVITSGPPKEHPWGEKSFLLIDPDGNRWEITQSPTPTGELIDRD